MIGQILEYNTVVTKAEFLFMIQSVNLPPSAHTITSSVHCSTLQPSAVIYSHPSSAHPVHTHCSSHYIFIAHCSYTISAHCSYTIQCTLQLHYLVSIPYSASSAPLDHHRVSLYHYLPTSRAVSRH